MGRRRPKPTGWQAKSHLFGNMPNFDPLVFKEDRAHEELRVQAKFPPEQLRKARSPRTSFATMPAGGGGLSPGAKKHQKARITLPTVHIKVVE